MTTDDDELDNDRYQAAMQPMSIDSRVFLLAERIRFLSKDNTDMKTRIIKLEAAYQRGVGIFILFPFLGGTLGFLATFWSSIFKPWK